MDIHAEMVLPTVCARVEQPNYRVSLRVFRLDLITVEQIARSARQGKIGHFISAAVPWWNDMFHLEREVQNGFRGVAILA